MISSDSDGLRVVFMGTPDFAVPALRAIAASRHDLVGVVTNPDRPSGRGKKMRPPVVKKAALAADVNDIYQPSKIRGNDDAYERISEWEPDVAVVAAYGQILPQRFLDIPTHGCLNIHASLLPKYRGASPINMAIVEGEEKSGVTIMQMEAGLDTGPIIARRQVDIPELMTAQELHDELAELGAEMIVDVLDRLAADGDLQRTEQDDEASSYAGMLSKEDGRVDWTRPARDVANLIRGMNPWPGAFSFLHTDDESQRIKFHLARVADVAGDGEPGEILEAAGDTLRVACGEGAIDILEIQPAGSRAMNPRDFNNGFDISPDAHFE